MRIIQATIIGIVAMSAASVFGRDLDGRWAQSPNKEWFDQLRNKSGNRCCSDADGRRVEDPDWYQTEKGYRVKLKPGGDWVDVPDSSVIIERNKVGYAMVWLTGDQNDVYCFMPGSSS